MFLQVHVVPRVRIRLNNVLFFLPNRACGVLTGTRSANVVSRIPISDACNALKPMLEQKGFPTPNGIHAVSNCVDNLTSLATSPHDACDILDHMCEHFQRLWGLEYKDSSMKEISARPIDVEVFNGHLVTQ